ncbi:MAG: 1-(5-phosphoribosyl)-5-[(5-phosphoribosylamino)methylideneamino]imidazole-4-carboxamide isomerase [Kiritimatiellia bacterium]
MIILPAIDLMNNSCVRLQQGRKEAMTIYSDNPLAQAQAWRAQGAQSLHIVDLDGAFSGYPKHTELITKIIQETHLQVEVGGGLRTDAAVETLMAAGVTRAIIGTRALEEPEALARWVQCYGDRIAVGIDARDGWVQVKGWVEKSLTSATELAKRVADCGVSTLIYTDIATDGMLGGTNLSAMAEMCDTVPHVKIIASGGVSHPDHVRALRALHRSNLFGAIVGKALYDGTTTLEAMIQATISSVE